MDKYHHYKKLIRDCFTAHYQRLTSAWALNLDINMALDDERGQYVLFKTGWQAGKEYVRYFSLHVALRHGKIYIEEDWTEDGIATDLLRLGVPREDIVLAFQPPQMRPYTEFAVA